jgi:peptidyl-tRNA hydrolase, PTH1 family
MFRRAVELADSSQCGREMKAVIGLGNPGSEYELTRHNAGFIAVDNLVEEFGGEFRKTRWKGLVARTSAGRTNVLAAKPHTFMNHSGYFVSPFINYYRIPAGDALVVHDEMDLPLGRIRLGRGGGAAGHRGVSSIVEQLGSQDFPRLRIGVGKPRGSSRAVGHVLSTFAPGEWGVLTEVIKQSVEAITVWLEKGLTEAMNEYNSLNIPYAESEEGG